MRLKTFVSLFSFFLLTLPALSQDGVKIIAHRGYWQTEGSAQNSIKALELADKINVYGSEFDVHLTADNVLVVYHDNEINGIPIQISNYADLKKSRLLNGEKLPTLKNYLKKGKKLNMARLIFELKPHATPGRNREAARMSVNMVNKAGLQDRTDYITFNLDAGKEFIRLLPQANVYYLNGDLSPKELKALGFTGLDYHYSVMQKHPEWFAEAKELGLLINVWTVNDPVLMEEMVTKGADYLTTDKPVEALQIVTQPLEPVW